MNKKIDQSVKIYHLSFNLKTYCANFNSSLQLSTKPSSLNMSGKTLNFPFLIIYLSLSMAAPKEPFKTSVSIKGGLIFETHEFPISVNSDTMQFHRIIDLDPLETAAQTLITNGKALQSFCDEIHQRVDDDPPKTFLPYTFTIHQQQQTASAVRYCREISAFPVEIRSQAVYSSVHSLMIRNNITYIPAGIINHGNGLKFVSDNSVAYNHSLIKMPALEKFPPLMIYARVKNELRLIPGNDEQEKDRNATLICQSPVLKTETTSFSFARMATIMCDRDLPGLEKTSSTVLQELAMLLNLKINPRKTQLRKKRSLGLLAGGLAVAGSSANIFSSSATNSAPLSWAGSILGNLFGWLSKDDLDIPIQAIIQNANQIDKIKVNLDEMVLHINKQTQALNDLKTQLKNHNFELLSYIMVVDFKEKLQTTITTIQIVAIKIVQALEDARNGQLSPYFLNAQELAFLQLKYLASHKIKINNDRTNIRPKLARANNTLFLLLNIPIEQDDSIFQLYAIQTLPIFRDDKAFRPKIDANFIAISSSGNEYTTLDAFEFANCIIDHRYCSISEWRYLMSQKRHCVIKSYITNTIACPLQESDDKNAFLKLFGNVTIYSVPKSTSVYVKCKYANRNEDTSMTFEGFGSAIIKPHCNIYTEDGRLHRSPPAPINEALDPTNLLNALKFIPKAAQTNLSAFDYAISTLAPIHLQPYGQNNISKSMLEEVLLPSKLAVTLTHFIIIVGTLLSLFCFCFMSKRFRLWMRTCCYCQHNKKWLDTIDEISQKPSFIGKKLAHWNKKDNPVDPEIQKPPQPLYPDTSTLKFKEDAPDIWSAPQGITLKLQPS